MNCALENIDTVLNQYEYEARAVEREVAELLIIMRGAITREDAWNMPYNEIKTLLKSMEKYLEKTKGALNTPF